MKKGYYKKSLEVHPDRVSENEKEEATEKFKVLSKLYNTLIDKEKRTLYDEKGIVEEDDEGNKLSDWLEVFQKLFKPISDEDINNFEREYIGSEMERNDIKKAYIQGKGCINHMMNCVPFFNVEDEPRVCAIVMEMIESGEVPEYKAFTEEPASKKKNRHRKYAREAELAKKEKEQLKNNTSLVEQIRNRHTERSNIFANIMQKYANMDEDEEDETVDFEVLKKMKSKNKNLKKGKRNSMHTVKNGKVKKGRSSK